MEESELISSLNLFCKKNYLQGEKEHLLFVKHHIQERQTTSYKDMLINSFEIGIRSRNLSEYLNIGNYLSYVLEV